MAKINFKQSKADNNSKSSISETGCLSKVKETYQPYYLPIACEWGWVQMK